MGNSLEKSSSDTFSTSLLHIRSDLLTHQSRSEVSILTLESRKNKILSSEINCLKISVTHSTELDINKTPHVTHPKKGDYCPVEIGDLYNNQYQVTKKLGVGGSATVWRCKDLQKKRNVAIKIVKSTAFDTRAAAIEIRNLKLVKDSNKFVKLLDYFMISDAESTHICMVLEPMSHDLLNVLIKAGREGIPLTTVKYIILQVLKGLDHLHSNCKLIHTDIKPHNILIRGDILNKSSLLVKISDLGSACSVEDPRSKGFQTFRYRSHEFLLEAPFSTSADIWSVACTSFELATRNCLFDSSAGADYSQNDDHLANTIALLGEIPKHVALSGMLSPVYFTEEGILRHFTNRKPWNVFDVLTINYKWEANEARKFVDFLLPMLSFDPEMRPTASDCIKYVLNDWKKTG